MVCVCVCAICMHHKQLTKCDYTWLSVTQEDGALRYQCLTCASCCIYSWEWCKSSSSSGPVAAYNEHAAIIFTFLSLGDYGHTAGAFLGRWLFGLN